MTNVIKIKSIKYFDERLAQGLIPSLNEFLYTIIQWQEEFNENEISKQEYTKLYYKLNSQSIIKNILTTDDLEEIIFLDYNLIKIKTSEFLYTKEIYIERLDYLRLIKVLIIENKIPLTTKNPFCSFTTKIFNSLFRVTILKKEDLPIIIFRKMSSVGFKLESFFQQSQSLSKIRVSLRSEKNILIAGKTGSGKTSLVQSLLNELTKFNEQICIIEDLQELNIESKNVIHLATDKMNRPIDELISWALRLSPQRIILGEIRSIEAIGFLNILNTGHKGSMATIHANSAKDAIDRLSFLINFVQSEMGNNHFQIKKLLVNFIDEVIFVENKKIKEHIKIQGTSNEGALYFEHLI